MSAAHDHIRGWIDQARWFGGKGRGWTLAGVRRVGELPDAPEGLHVAIDLAEVAYDDGTTDYYQLPLALYAEPQDRLSHALVGEWDDAEHGRAYVYDALHDRVSMGLWLAAFAAHGVETVGVPDRAERGVGLGPPALPVGSPGRREQVVGLAHPGLRAMGRRPA